MQSVIPAKKDLGTPPHVVIVGGGFGGLEAAKHLDALPVRVTLVDARNHHLFQPLLYQVATAGLSPSDIALPIRSVLRKRRRVRTLLDRVSRIDLEGREVHLEHGPPLRYDYLVLAAGARTNYFGNDRWAEHALGLKSVEDALAIRRRVLLSYEEAERGLEPDELRRKLTFVVIGGGPTGVEVAGAIAELARRVLSADYHNIDPHASRVVLVEAAPQILGGFDPALSEAARRDLEKLGVEVRTGAPVRDITAEGVHLDDELLRAGVVVWGAGVSASPLADTLGVPQDRAGRVIVNRDCSIPGHPEAYAIGDIARFEREDGQPLPGVSPVAMQQARAVVRNVGRRMAGQQAEPFEYYDKGMMATIGRTHAVAQSHGIKMTGMLAWLAWLFIHLWYLVGFKNRVFVLLNWIWSYVMFRRGARLITGEQPPGIEAQTPASTRSPAPPAPRVEVPSSGGSVRSAVDVSAQDVAERPLSPGA